MGAEFNWWLLIVGIVAGGALTWLVLADSTRRERELADEEVAAEASWIARTLDHPELDAGLAEDVLRAHRRYLGFPPPDVLVDPGELASLEARGAGAEPPPDLAGDDPPLDAARGSGHAGDQRDGAQAVTSGDDPASPA